MGARWWCAAASCAQVGPPAARPCAPPPPRTRAARSCGRGQWCGVAAVSTVRRLADKALLVRKLGLRWVFVQIDFRTSLRTRGDFAPARTHYAQGLELRPDPGPPVRRFRQGKRNDRPCTKSSWTCTARANSRTTLSSRCSTGASGLRALGPHPRWVRADALEQINAHLVTVAPTHLGPSGVTRRMSVAAIKAAATVWEMLRWASRYAVPNR